MAGLPGELIEKIHALPELQQGALLIIGGALEGFVRHRNGTDAAGHSRRQEVGQDSEEPSSVVQPFGLRPVRGIDLFLHPLPVELAIREPVNGEHVGIVAFQPFLKGPEGARFDELPGSAVAQSKPDGVGSA